MSKLSTWAKAIKTSTWVWKDSYSPGPVAHLSLLLQEIVQKPPPPKLYGYSFLFNNQTNSDLGADGYDNYQAPQFEGKALYSRRMWVSGLIEYPGDPPKVNDQILCTELVTSVRSVNNSVFVSISRNFLGSVGPVMSETRALVYTNEKYKQTEDAGQKDKGASDGTQSDEVNDIARLAESELFLAEALSSKNKGLEGPYQPLLLKFTLDQVRRYCALTYNLHKIHLDKAYCVLENLKDVVVPGPMLVLTLLYYYSTLNPEAKIQSFKYRNSEPCYVDENVKLVISENVVKFQNDGRTLCSGTITLR